jgi:hypothetical protein
MGSIPAIPEARNVPVVLCHERFNEASLPATKRLACDSLRKILPAKNHKTLTWQIKYVPRKYVYTMFTLGIYLTEASKWHISSIYVF